MGTDERITMMEEEIRKLKQDNQMLMKIIVQMKGTINRLVIRYVSKEDSI